MNTNKLFKSWVTAIGLLVFLFCGRSGATPPNIVIILADDMGYGDPHFAGGKVPTPNLDRFAAEGMRFTDSHTSSSVCTPTRYGILTGRYNWRSPMKQGVLGGSSKPLIPTARTTIASLLKQEGYHTGFIGKWHLGLGWEKAATPWKATTGPTAGEGWDLDFTKAVANGPTKLGFDEDFLIAASLDMPPYVYLRNDKPTSVPTVTRKWIREGAAAADFEANRCLRDWAQEAREFIGRATQDKAKPFFLYLSLTSPHTPILPSERWIGKSGIGAYGDFIMETDWVVGEVLAELEARGLTQNTVVFFTADNGCSPAAGIQAQVAQGHKPNGDWRGMKADIWEGGHRTPFLVRWPGTVKAGSTCTTTICTTDFMATVADIAGNAASIPANAAEDSFSILPLMKGADDYKRTFTIHHSIKGAFAIRQGPWKLCLCPDSGGWSDPKPDSPASAKLYPVQLYHLADDPAESKNLAEQQPEKVKELSELLAKAIHHGRTTPGPTQRNDGDPKTFPARVTELLPIFQFATKGGKTAPLKD